MVIKGESMPTPCKITKLNRKECSSEAPEVYSGYSDGRKYINHEISEQPTLIQAPNQTGSDASCTPLGTETEHQRQDLRRVLAPRAVVNCSDSSVPADSTQEQCKGKLSETTENEHD